MTNEESIRILKEIYSCTNTTLMQENISFERERILLDDCKALTMAIEALEKQIPKKPEKIDRDEYEYIRCALCGNPFTIDEAFHRITHCECGQSILWEDEP